MPEAISAVPAGGADQAGLCRGAQQPGVRPGKSGQGRGCDRTLRTGVADQRPIIAEAHYNMGNALARAADPGCDRTLRAGATDQARLCRGATTIWGCASANWEDRRTRSGITSRRCGSSPITPRRTTIWGCPAANGQAAGSHGTLRAGAADQARLRRGALQLGHRCWTGKVREAVRSMSRRYGSSPISLKRKRISPMRGQLRSARRQAEDEDDRRRATAQAKAILPERNPDGYGAESWAQRACWSSGCMRT